MNFKLLPVSQEDLTEYKKNMQEAFKKRSPSGIFRFGHQILMKFPVNFPSKKCRQTCNVNLQKEQVVNKPR